MSQFGVVTYREQIQDTSVELKTVAGGSFLPMTTNPVFLEVTHLEGRALYSGIQDCAIYLNGVLSNNLFAIEKGADYLTFQFIGNEAIFSKKFLFEINVF